MGKVPKVENGTTAIIIFVINFFFPGIGTIVAGVLSKDDNKDIQTFNIIFGIIQLVLAWFFIGWIIALVWSYFIYDKSK